DGQLANAVRGRLEEREVLKVVPIPVEGAPCLRAFQDPVFEPVEEGIKDRDNQGRLRADRGRWGLLAPFSHAAVGLVADRLAGVPAAGLALVRRGCVGWVFAQKSLLAAQLDVPAAAVAEPGLGQSRHRQSSFFLARDRQGGRWGRFPL